MVFLSLSGLHGRRGHVAEIARVSALLVIRHGFPDLNYGIAMVSALLWNRYGFRVTTEAIRSSWYLLWIDVGFASLFSEHWLRGTFYGVATVSTLLLSRYGLRVTLEPTWPPCYSEIEWSRHYLRNRNGPAKLSNR